MKHTTLAMAAGFTALALTMGTAKADFNLVGNTLLVGINSGGSIVQNTVAGPTPTSPFIGIQYDSTGMGNYSKGYDFITPGDPYQYFSLGANGSFASNSYDHGNNLGLTTTNTSSGTTLQATSTGATPLGITMNMTQTFQMSGTGSGIIEYAVNLTNTSGAALSNVGFSTGLDPDQDVYFDGSYYTSNVLQSKDFLYGTGLGTAWTIGIQNTSVTTPTGTWIGDGDSSGSWDYGYGGGVVGDATASDQNPYNTFYGTSSTTGGFDGSASFVGPGTNYGDYTLNMAWQLGDLAAGATDVLTYEYVIAATPSAAGAPDAASTLALFGVALACLGAARRKLTA
jgi:hypothetical protein